MWKILNSCTTGFHHAVLQKDCQDRFRIEQTQDRLVLAVADGHGGTPHCRSALGAEMACDSAIEILTARDVPWEDATAGIKALFDEKLALHLDAEPLTEAEIQAVNGYPPEIAYGTTLLCAAITPDGVFRAQIGDGEIHVLTASGTFLPELPEDENCVSFFTSSLVAQDAPLRFRWAFDPEPAAAAVLYSDGYLPRADKPWKLLEALLELPDQIPPEVLEAGQRGDDQTLAAAVCPQAVSTQTFREGYAEEQGRSLAQAQRAALLRQICDADAAIRRYIRKLDRSNENIQIRSRLIELLWKQQQKFLALCREYHGGEEDPLPDFPT